MSDSDWMTAKETAHHIRLNFRKGSKEESREKAFRAFLNRADNFPKPSRRTGRELGTSPMWTSG